MKQFKKSNPILAALVATSLVSAVAIAGENGGGMPHARGGMPTDNMMAGSGNGGMMPMSGQMGMMQGQMQAIHAAKTPEERRKAMAAHRQSMHDMMKMMQGMQAGESMMGPGMMGSQGGGMRGPMDGPGALNPNGGAMGPGGQPMMATPGGAMGSDMGGARTQMMERRMEMMSQRMDMMQGVMDQMIQHQAAQAEETK